VEGVAAEGDAAEEVERVGADGEPESAEGDEAGVAATVAIRVALALTAGAAVPHELRTATAIAASSALLTRRSDDRTKTCPFDWPPVA
jgi:hypothetical protein